MCGYRWEATVVFEILQCVLSLHQLQWRHRRDAHVIGSVLPSMPEDLVSTNDQVWIECDR